MPKKRSLIALFGLAVSTLFLCCLETNRIYAGADHQFESFTDALFRQEVSSNTITLHYTIQNPSDYQIENPEVSFGNYSISSSEISSAAENALASLREIPCSELTAAHQTTWRILEDSFSRTLEGVPYLLYDEPLCPLTGIQTQLPILLSEYQFHSTEDVDTYLTLLHTLPDHFASLISFEQAKADAGLFMTDTSAASVIKECNSFLNTGSSNYLYASFEDRIHALKACSEKEKKDYIAQNEAAIKSSVLPAYKDLLAALKDLRSRSSSSGGLCRLPDGKSYYQYLVKEETGSDRSIDELKELTLTQIQQDLVAMQTILTASDESVSEASIELDSGSDPAAILAHLQKKITPYFPDAGTSNTQVKYVSSEMAEYVSPAFYMVPAIDNTGSQTIYINSLHLPDDLDLFTTLAHEGYPGHLYQHVYYASTDPDPIRSILDCGGYTEGWATYAEMLSYYFTSLSSEQASLCQHNASAMLGLYAMADMGIHYDGWSLTDTLTFFRDYGIQDSDTVRQIYDLITADPANYLKYYIGYVEFLELKKEAIEKWNDDFSQMRFHKAVLDAGSMPFYLLRNEVLQE